MDVFQNTSLQWCLLYATAEEEEKKPLEELLFLGSDLSKRQDFKELSNKIFLTITEDWLLVRAGLKCIEFQCINIVRIFYHLYSGVTLNTLALEILTRQRKW